MSSKQERNIKAGAAAWLRPSEEVRTYLIASARGHQQAMAGGVAGLLGAGRAGAATRDAAAAGIELASPMVFILTQSRLLTAELGNAGKVKRELGTFDLDEVGAMTVKRRGLAASASLLVRDVEVRLETRAGPARAFADALAIAKSSNGS